MFMGSDHRHRHVSCRCGVRVDVDVSRSTDHGGGGWHRVMVCDGDVVSIELSLERFGAAVASCPRGIDLAGDPS